MPFSDILFAIRWWAVLLMISTAVFPLSFTLFHRLPDKGIAFSKPLGLLIISYTFWIFGSLGFVNNDLGGVLVGVSVLLPLSFWAWRKMGDGVMRRWIRTHWKHLLLTELLFALLFFLWVWVRAQNPSISATEKPMEFAFLNSMARTTQFPPNDPWLSGFGISYYYFGYLMSGVLGKLTAVPTPIAFNLSLAWLVAGTGVAAFGLVFNLLAAYGRQTAVTFALIAAFAIPLAGNMVMGLELAYADNIGSETFWEWLDIRDFDTPVITQETPRYQTSRWWWWRSSRPIHEQHLNGRYEESVEPIVEFPAFSFILGDLHPHVLALPFIFLSLAMAQTWFLGGTGIGTHGSDSLSRSPIPDPRSLFFTILILGSLAFLNTWDLLPHLFIMMGAFALERWRNGRLFFTHTILLALTLVVGIFLLYYPFFLGFSSQAAAPYLLPMLMRPTRLPHFAAIFGMSLLPITVLMGVLLVRQQFSGWKTGVATAVTLPVILFIIMLFFGWIIAVSPAGAGEVTNIAAEVGVTLPPHPSTPSLSWGVTAVTALLPILLSVRLAIPAVTILLASLIATAYIIINHQQWRERDEEKPRSALPFALLLIMTAALLTLGTEFLYLRDNFGVRMNTIFKFYYQAWVLFGVGGLFSLGYLWQRSRKIGLLAITVYAAMFGLAMAYPVYAATSRAVEYRGARNAATRRPATLDGMAYRAWYNAAEYDAILWMRDNVEGEPVIVEATGGAYSDYGRFAANTGLPTLLGWANHEYQWRGGGTPEPARRQADIRDIYTHPDWGLTTTLLDQYNAAYIIVGGLERSEYGAAAGEKFDGRLQTAFRNDDIIIYRWAK